VAHSLLVFVELLKHKKGKKNIQPSTDQWGIVIVLLDANTSRIAGFRE